MTNYLDLADEAAAALKRMPGEHYELYAGTVERLVQAVRELVRERDAALDDNELHRNMVVPGLKRERDEARAELTIVQTERDIFWAELAKQKGGG